MAKLNVSGRIINVVDGRKSKENPQDTTVVVIDEENEGNSMIRVKLPAVVSIEKYSKYTLVGEVLGYVQGSNTYLRMVPGYDLKLVKS